jgi:hypothetical protein
MTSFAQEHLGNRAVLTSQQTRSDVPLWYNACISASSLFRGLGFSATKFVTKWFKTTFVRNYILRTKVVLNHLVLHKRYRMHQPKIKTKFVLKSNYTVYMKCNIADEFVTSAGHFKKCAGGMSSIATTCTAVACFSVGCQTENEAGISLCVHL